ncbi:hypothetical protein Ade02nite_22820 [Paractinoplanes deccanensis]|uniref:Uncharacterized protein n=1 Tax=Paractinoplanes deccanensis TaxID=113561 RepID=A0ABQ3Y0V8_9ACTN|nr:hypothetical protein [Actinoplanes deccanensis]GID73641.1 hypothetical protein Ade02nite_22820 [Actinoplanes deccanensis]
MCELCGRPVLGLTGWDWTLLPWMTGGEATGVIPGPCHVACLRERGVATEWAAAVEAYHCARWPLFLGGRDGAARWRLHAGPRARRFHWWRSDGRLASFPYSSMSSDPPAVTGDLAEVGSAQAGDLLAAMGTDEIGRPAPLDRVIARLGLADRYPGCAGTVARRIRNVGTVRRPELVDVLEARVDLPVDAGCREAARELVMGSGHGHER